jgi:hypothetical protein
MYATLFHILYCTIITPYSQHNWQNLILSSETWIRPTTPESFQWNLNPSSETWILPAKAEFFRAPHIPDDSSRDSHTSSDCHWHIRNSCSLGADTEYPRSSRHRFAKLFWIEPVDGLKSVHIGWWFPARFIVAFWFPQILQLSPNIWESSTHSTCNSSSFSTITGGGADSCYSGRGSSEALFRKGIGCTGWMWRFFDRFSR